MCCSLMVEARFTLWQIDNKRSTSEQELDLLTQQNELLQTHATKYPQLGQKVSNFVQLSSVNSTIRTLRGTQISFKL